MRATIKQKLTDVMSGAIAPILEAIQDVVSSDELTAKLEAQVESEREAVRLLRRESEAQRTAALAEEKRRACLLVAPVDAWHGGATRAIWRQVPRLPCSPRTEPRARGAGPYPHRATPSRLRPCLLVCLRAC